MNRILSYRIPVWAIVAALSGAVLVAGSTVFANSQFSFHVAYIGLPLAILAMGTAGWLLSEGRTKKARVSEAANREAMINAELAKVVAIIRLKLAHDERYARSLTGVQGTLERRPSVDELASIVDLIIVENQKARENAAYAIRELGSAQATISKLQQSLKEAVAETLKDPLTGIANRRSFQIALADAVASAQAAHDRPLTLVLCDLDHFKRVNDEFGHSMGDQVLKLAAQALSSSVRSEDVVCRFGGEEFAIILPNTALKEALSVSERMRSQLLSKTLAIRGTDKTVGRISASFGVAERHDGDDAKRLIDRADAALYKAKSIGRNCVVS